MVFDTCRLRAILPNCQLDLPLPPSCPTSAPRQDPGQETNILYPVVCESGQAPCLFASGARRFAESECSNHFVSSTACRVLTRLPSYCGYIAIYCDRARLGEHFLALSDGQGVTRCSFRPCLDVVSVLRRVKHAPAALGAHCAVRLYMSIRSQVHYELLRSLGSVRCPPTAWLISLFQR